jgi:hypothetical protein
VCVDEECCIGGNVGICVCTNGSDSGCGACITRGVETGVVLVVVVVAGGEAGGKKRMRRRCAVEVGGVLYV